MIAEDEKYKGTWRHLRRKGMKRAISTLRGGVKDKAKVRSTLRDGVKDKKKVMKGRSVYSQKASFCRRNLHGRLAVNTRERVKGYLFLISTLI